jgi:metal-responsive CopG/Arc/MetJ family transcriptional regulator
MKSIQITIGESLLSRVDKHTGERNRSSFFRQDAQLLLKHLEIQQLEQAHRKGYQRKPVSPDEFVVDEQNQAWPS